jgi:hypothetical protein
MRVACLKVWQCVSRILSFPESTKRSKVAHRATPLLEVDPFWHGDHWQNLLASPMDARHYIMEDWAVPTGELEEPHAARANERRGDRRRRC